MSTSPLLGMRVKLGRDVPCCDDIAVVGPGAGPHAAELTCAICGRHCGWLSKSTASWLETVINKFGAPTTPIVLRSAATWFRA
jgi:hypothetical protein